MFSNSDPEAPPNDEAPSSHTPSLRTHPNRSSLRLTAPKVYGSFAPRRGTEAPPPSHPQCARCNKALRESIPSLASANALSPQKRVTTIESSRTHVKPGAGLPVLVEDVSANWEMVFRFEVLSPTGAKALIAVQESGDGFINDIRTLAVFDEVGQIGDKTVDSLVRSSRRPSARIGQPGIALRVFVEAITLNTTANTTLLLISR